MKIKSEIIETKSIADLILERTTGFRYWILKKLIPAALWEYPPQRIASLQKGAVIGQVTIDIIDLKNFDIGEKIDEKK